MKVVVAIDGRTSAQTAVEHIVKQNYAQDTQILLVHVIVPGFADAPVEGIPDVVEEERQEEKSVLANTKKQLQEKLSIEATTAILNGEVAQVIADECKRFDADEVIVPSHARHGFSRLWFGSVADEIVDEAPCTVVVLKMPQDSKR